MRQSRGLKTTTEFTSVSMTDDDDNLTAGDH
jgi:hypothetical protein